MSNDQPRVQGGTIGGHGGEFTNKTQTEPTDASAPQPVESEFAQGIENPPEWTSVPVISPSDPRPIEDIAYIDLSAVEGFRQNERVFYAQGMAMVEQRTDFTQFVPSTVPAHLADEWLYAHTPILPANGGIDDDGSDWDQTWWGVSVHTDHGLNAQQVLEAVEKAGLAKQLREHAATGFGIR